MSTQTFSTFSSDAPSAYIAAKTLMVAKKATVMYGLCDHPQQPEGEGRTFQYTRYERLNLPQSPLTEGTTPSDSAMSITTVQAVMDQWGAVVPISDVAMYSVKHPVLQKAINLLGLQAAETIDREVIECALTGTQIYYPNAITARGSLTSSDKISSASIGKVTANLRAKGAQPYNGGTYFVGVIDSYSEDEIQNDTTFIDAAKYGQVTKLFNQEVGAWKGVRWVRSNFLPNMRLQTGASGTGSATGGSLVASTTYNAKLVVVDAKTGFETFATATFNAATGMGQTSVDITVPALNASATAGSLYRLYFGSNGGTLYLAASDISPSTTYNQKTLPTSGQVAPAAAPSGICVHFAFVLGQEGLACVELKKLQAYLTKAEPTDSDPLVQRRKAGWKVDFKPVITNDDFIARLEHVTTNNPA